ncbi:MAG TPA: peptide-methionine (S)-S-oxide reductase MsrA [Bacteriovoracaceae bacterium]|nr:peptide-methionine (S)-S-oxide reductase MsrA [Bacteriovoracaceae bacterium]
MNEKAIFGAGCFWSVEESFREMKGVLSTQAGYAGGTLESPSYEDVCSGTSGHIEVVEVSFDPEIVSYQELLEKFFAIHDPTGDHRWDNVAKRQYQSVIFVSSQEQSKAAQSKIEKLQTFSRPVSTIILPSTIFYPAEERHQHYTQKRKQLYEGRI